MKIPTLQEIKKLNKSEEHEFILFQIIDSVCCKLTYNEDLNGGLWLDIMCDGFVEELDHDKHFELSEYDKMVETAKLWRKEILNNLMGE